MRIGTVWLCSLLALSLLALGCSKECKPGQDLECWIGALKNPEQVSKAIDNIKQINDPKAAPALIDVFAASAEEPETRERLAEMFRKWKVKEAIKPMIDALDFTVGPSKDGKKAKRINRANQKIASALGTLGDASAVQPLMRLLKATKEPDVQRAAIRALGKLRAKEVVDDLIRMTEDTTVLPVIRLNAIYALGEIGDAKAVPSLVMGLYREKAYYFAQARLALVKIGEPAVDLLVKTMNGENPDAKKLTEGNVEILAGALEANAALVLGDIGSPLAVEPLLKMIDKVAKWEEETNRILVQTRLFAALGNIGDARGIKAIMSYLDKEPDEKYWDVRLICATALNTISDRSVIADIWKLLDKGGHPRARAPLIELIGNLATDEALPKLKELQAKEKDVTLQPVIADAIKKIEAFGRCKQDAACWQGLLDGKETSLRERAIYEIGRIGDAGSVDGLLKHIGDESENVRFALMFAFDKIKSRKVVEPIEQLVEKEKGSARFNVANFNYQLVNARLHRTATR
jgi:HEAT repeat protein